MRARFRLMRVRRGGGRAPVASASTTASRLTSRSLASARSAAVALAVAFGGCASPTDRIDRMARDLGYQRSIVRGVSYDHVVYARPEARAATRVHVYIENDGRPWQTPVRVSDDPTPRQPLALRLMGRDPGPAIYLGRPCYLEATGSAPCDPVIWTDARYGEEVVTSMISALRRFLPYASSRLVLIGHSGGGTLAVLMARQMPEVEAVVTVAGNLDVNGWTALHDYSPLAGSLDPAALAPDACIAPEIHLVGARDSVVPDSLAERYVVDRPAVRSVLVGGFDHACCWERDWPQLLGRATTMLDRLRVQRDVACYRAQR